MPCYHLLRAFQTLNGEVVFDDRRASDIVRELSLPCGRCIGCRLEKSRQWALRCMHESRSHKANAFVTLTYDEAHVPYRSQLQYVDFQKFLRRLRKHVAPQRVRFYMCGEYGGQFGRPHFHACLFGIDFPDRLYWSTMESGAYLYRSDLLARLWPFGFCSVGDVTFESAGYVARYCVQKHTGFNARYHYLREDEDGVFSLPPEFNHMSLKPGIGATFYRRWRDDIYPHDYCVVNGKECKPPRYYDRLLEREDPVSFREVQVLRELEAWDRRGDNTPERLVAKEAVQKARASFLLRSMNDYS